MCRNRQKSKVHERLPCRIVYGITNLNFCRWMILSVSDTGLVGWLCTVYLASEQGADFLVTGRPPKSSFQNHNQSPVPLHLWRLVPCVNDGAHFLQTGKQKKPNRDRRTSRTGRHLQVYNSIYMNNIHRKNIW